MGGTRSLNPSSSCGESVANPVFAKAGPRGSFHSRQRVGRCTQAQRVLEFAPAEQNQALCGNKVDAIIFEAGHPNGLTQEATTDCRARLVRVAGQPIDRLLATHPYYIASVIPGGMYSGNPGDVPTIGTRAVLVSSSTQPAELVHAMVKAVFNNIAVFRQLHPALSTLNIQEVVPSASVIPIHQGALNYYREVGLIQ